MKITYRQRILAYFIVIFALFTLSIVFFEQSQEKKYRTEALESKLDGYAETVSNYISKNGLADSSIIQLKNIADVLPDDIRLTVMNNEGNVLFDKDVADVKSMENHADRPEIRSALFQQYGTNIRMSASTKHEYLYYAKHYSNYFVRVALPYNIGTKGLLQADNYFIYIVSILFIVVLALLYFVANRFGKSISQLKQFSIDIRHGKPLPDNANFPDDELGDVGRELVELFRQKERNKKALEAEKEKLIQHFQYSEEGLGIFDQHQNKVYVNTHFIQYVNLIADKPTLEIGNLLNEDIFEPIQIFLLSMQRESNFMSVQINKNGKIYLLKVIVFEDKSFELTIKDITKIEKNRILKQEMTSNIAHELRTPVTCLRGFLETLQEQQLPEEKQAQFIEKAHIQSIRLSELIEDISLLSKIEESATSFAFEKVNLGQMLDNVRIDLADKLAVNNIKFCSSVGDILPINGNYTLLYSAFRNLMDNSIKYGGQNIEIHIDKNMEDNNAVYLSYYDTGIGVDEQHLNRLFERFYRVNEGRTRSTGGSGLGLSIVRNVIMLHKGEIQVKNHKDGGLEFLIMLRK